jgi:uncharacterized protein (DUF2164 family)
MRIQLSDERRALLVKLLKRHFAAEFDEPLSDFRAEGLVAFFLKELGPPVYNQGVRDAAAFIQSKLGDIDGEVFEPET